MSTAHVTYAIFLCSQWLSIPKTSSAPLFLDDQHQCLERPRLDHSGHSIQIANLDTRFESVVSDCSRDKTRDNKVTPGAAAVVVVVAAAIKVVVAVVAVVVVVVVV
ncbi:LOW QUALITY PROTEIN: hypothetical protein ElyMa_002725000 [Elysia marginata]|uniref:Uncharacterized protein n=1 Tax=Elysia marginata TaxID=1093978 RepID=A0AAV4HIN5_9GAST|nr:LOW QUALITY PROTEIN: hypothetical protein ElyMa_002725000 [Elysia marginata]